MSSIRYQKAIPRSKSSIEANNVTSLFFNTIEESSDVMKGKALLVNYLGQFNLVSANEDKIEVKVPSSNGLRCYVVSFCSTGVQKEYLPVCTCPQWDNAGTCKHISAGARWLDMKYTTIPLVQGSVNSTEISEKPVAKETAPKKTAKKVKAPTTIVWEVDPREFYKQFNLFAKPYDWESAITVFPERLPNWPLVVSLTSWQASLLKTTIAFDGGNKFTLQCQCTNAKPCYHLNELAKQLFDQRGLLYFNCLAEYNFDRKAFLISRQMPAKLLELPLRFGMNVRNGIVILREDWMITDEAEIPKFINAAETDSAKNLTSENRVDLIPLLEVCDKGRSEKSWELNWKFYALPLEEKKAKAVVLEMVDERVIMGIEDFPIEMRKALASEITRFHLHQQREALFEKRATEQLREKLAFENGKVLETADAFWKYAISKNRISVKEIITQKSKKAKPELFIPQEKSLTIEIEYDGDENTSIAKLLFIGENLRMPISRVRIIGHYFIAIEQKLYFVNDHRMPEIENRFSSGVLFFSTRVNEAVRKKILPQWEANLKVLRRDLPMEKLQVPLVFCLKLSEANGEFLIFEPAFMYGENIISAHEMDQQPIGTNQGLDVVVIRSTEDESKWMSIFWQLHGAFELQKKEERYSLKIDEVRTNGWFVNTMMSLRERGALVLGEDQLKRVKFSYAKPKFVITEGHSNDWFDMAAHVDFDGESVSIRRVQKALYDGLKYVELSDGKQGILPDEWLTKYELIIKMAEVKGEDRLRLNSLHAPLLDEADIESTDEDFRMRLQERKHQLSSITRFANVQPSKRIKATLRPYQIEGFQWFHHMQSLGIGACLADDMGLGKTLQTIAYIDYALAKEKKEKIMVVCPTSLLFNWESELRKFAPHIKFLVHHGTTRISQMEDMKCRLILTSYGTMRNDFEILNTESWGCLILDESQAIKNPDAQISKAAMSLKARFKIVLSGTPIQNNTFDLWSQINFVNRGLLGNKAFFRDQFSIPIDKSGQTEVSGQLKRLTAPFILRRTKEQVASELPEKTESILWCEMTKTQRKIYDEVREFYRFSLSKAIEDFGVEKMKIQVLEGLLRLRQICDSPKLLKRAEYLHEEGAKLSELTREIVENTGQHKVLIFSQFTEMLSLIEAKLQQSGVEYCQITGSTPLKKRKAEVERFQTSEETRVFLISLKAGGVGLNLTAADYVYLVDPWWNPAAEQQAIDRSHRIGQNKSVFAYKLICKDSIEEKILKLQEHKKGIAKDIISDDAGLLRKMTGKEILELFS